MCNAELLLQGPCQLQFPRLDYSTFFSPEDCHISQLKWMPFLAALHTEEAREEALQKQTLLTARKSRWKIQWTHILAFACLSAIWTAYLVQMICALFCLLLSGCGTWICTSANIWHFKECQPGWQHLCWPVALCSYEGCSLQKETYFRSDSLPDEGPLKRDLFHSGFTFNHYQKTPLLQAIQNYMNLVHTLILFIRGHYLTNRNPVKLPCICIV